MDAIAPHGLHHVTAIAEDPQRNVDFYTTVLGLRTVNLDATDAYHLYYGDETGSPSTLLTFFPGPERRLVNRAPASPRPPHSVCRASPSGGGSGDSRTSASRRTSRSAVRTRTCCGCAIQTAWSSNWSLPTAITDRAGTAPPASRLTRRSGVCTR
jgi:Glyoxalase/Bleomycin resistance protein/Dioxygenase superfamily